VASPKKETINPSMTALAAEIREIFEVLSAEIHNLVIAAISVGL